VQKGLVADSGSRLRHCEGFRVESPGGSLGFVEEVIFTRAGDEPQALVVVGGLSARQRWVVPVGDVTAVRPRRELVSVESSPANVRHLAERRGEVASFVQTAL
jgi:hypothetical protein